MQQLRVKKIYSQSVSPVATHLTPSFLTQTTLLMSDFRQEREVFTKIV